LFEARPSYCLLLLIEELHGLLIKQGAIILPRLNQKVMCRGIPRREYLKRFLTTTVVKRFNRCKKNKRALNKFAKRIEYFQQLGLQLGYTVVFSIQPPSFVVKERQGLFGDNPGPRPVLLNSVFELLDNRWVEVSADV
jgi:hypothetical protein